MPAEHALDMVALGIANNCVLVGADETDRVFHPLLDRFAERPITESKSPAHSIYERVESEEKLIADIAEKGEPLDILHDGVELVPVQDEDPASVGRNVKCVFLDRDRAVSAEMTGEKLIVIAWNVDDPRPFAGLAQNLLNHVVMLLRPVNATFERPDIDQITDDVERLELVFLEEGKKRRGIAAAGAKMDVGDPPRTVAVRAFDHHDPSVAKGKRASKSSIVTFLRQRYGLEIGVIKGLDLFRLNAYTSAMLKSLFAFLLAACFLAGCAASPQSAGPQSAGAGPSVASASVPASPAQGQGNYRTIYVPPRVGSHLGVVITDYQPMKIAATEAQWETCQPCAFSLFQIGGFSKDDQTPSFDIAIPHLLSLLATDSWNGEVQGMNEIQAQYEQQYGPGNYSPPSRTIYWSMRIMAYLGTLVALVALVGAFLYRKGRLERTRWFLWLAVVSIAFPYLSALAGWVLSEVGRQPWIVQGLLKTADANSPSVGMSTIALSLGTFAVLYLLLGVVDFVLMRHYATLDPPPAGGEGDEAAPAVGY